MARTTLSLNDKLDKTTNYNYIYKPVKKLLYSCMFHEKKIIHIYASLIIGVVIKVIYQLV